MRGLARKMKRCNDVLHRAAGGFHGLLDAVHGLADLLFQIIDHVFLQLIALVRMVVVDRQCRPAGEPEDLAALDLDRRDERHEHRLVVVGMVDDLQMLARGRIDGLALGRRRGAENCCGGTERGERHG